MSPGTGAATGARGGGLRLLWIAVAMGALAGCSKSSSSPRSEPSKTTTSTTTIAKPHRPAQVTVFGDSLSVQAGVMLRSQGRAHGLKVTVAAYFGLAPCDLAKAAMSEIERGPDALVLAFTGNNLTPCMQRNGQPLFGTAYFDAYREQTGALVAAAVARKIPVLVVGAPTFPEAQNIPDRVELNSVLQEVAETHPGARYVATAPDVSPQGFARVLPCLPEETAALGCTYGRIIVRGGNGIHFDDPREVPCPTGTEICLYTAGGHRFANAIMAGLAAIGGLGYQTAAANVGVPAIKALDG